jgi:putative hydroxymethylpyrimidine transport system permease protein
VATAVAPIGAVVGEWVGSSAGLGHFMLLSNARMQVDVMFAALVTLAVLSVTLYSIVDTLLRRMIPWSPDTHPADD